MFLDIVTTAFWVALPYMGIMAVVTLVQAWRKSKEPKPREARGTFSGNGGSGKRGKRKRRKSK